MGISFFGPEAFPAIDEGLFVGQRCQSFGQGENFQNAGFRAIPHLKSAGFLDIAHHKDSACFGHPHFFSPVSFRFASGSAKIDQGLDRDALHQRRGKAVEPRLRRADQDFRTGLGGQPARAGHGLKQGHRRAGLERQGRS